MAKTKRLKTVKAGRLVWSVCYTQPQGRDNPKQRAAKTKLSNLARQRLNFKAAYQKLWLMIAANFDRGDLWVTLTYSDENLPANRKAAKKEIAAFFDRVRKQRKANGQELKYIYCTHELTDDGQGRLHHHLVINSSGSDDYELIRSLWTNGDNIEIRPLGNGEHYHYDDFSEIAKYMMHERRPDLKGHATGDRGYCCSRNLQKPEVTSKLIDDELSSGPPAGAYIIESDSKYNEFGSFVYFLYLLPERRKT